MIIMIVMQASLVGCTRNGSSIETKAEMVFPMRIYDTRAKLESDSPLHASRWSSMTCMVGSYPLTHRDPSTQHFTKVQTDEG